MPAAQVKSYIRHSQGALVGFGSSAGAESGVGSIGSNGVSPSSTRLRLAIPSVTARKTFNLPEPYHSLRPLIQLPRSSAWFGSILSAFDRKSSRTSSHFKAEFADNIRPTAADTVAAAADVPPTAHVPEVSHHGGIVCELCPSAQMSILLP